MRVGGGCKHARRNRRLVDRALGNALSAGKQARLFEHLHTCRTCRDYYDAGARGLWALAGSHEACAPDLERVRVRLGLQPPRLVRTVSLWTAGLSAAVALAVLLWMSPDRTEPAGAGAGEPVLVSAAERSAAPRAVLPSGRTVAQVDLGPTEAGRAGSNASARNRWARTPVPDASVPADSVWFAFDFESEQQLVRWRAGEWMSGPKRARSRKVLKAIPYHGERSTSLGVRLEDHEDGLFVYQPDLWCEFRYWLGEGERSSYIELAFTTDENREYVLRVLDPPKAAWGHAVVWLGDAHPYDDDDARPPPGALITKFKLRTYRLEQDTFFVDDVRLFQWDIPGPR